MSTLLTQIGGIASLGSLILSKPAILKRGSTDHAVRASRKSSQKPYRANENRKPFDAEFRLDGHTSPVEPFQNDLLLMDSEEWIVWRITPSPAGSHWMLACMAPATVMAIPLLKAETPDGQGGKTLVWADQPEMSFYCKVRESSVDRQLNADAATSMGKLAMSFQADTAPAGFNTKWRVRLSNEERAFEILSITVDDENPAWRNAVLAKEGWT